MGDLPEFALSIRQPWAWLITNGFKDIENRTWSTKFRGPFLIHAGKGWDVDDRETHADLRRGVHPVSGGAFAEVVPDKPALGGIVGVAEIVDCVTTSSSDWFVGKYGFVIKNAQVLPFRPVSGALGWFRPGIDVGRQGKLA